MGAVGVMDILEEKKVKMGKCPANRNVFAADGFRYLPDGFHPGCY